MEVGKGGRKRVCQMLVLLVYLQSQGRWVKARGLENSHITGRQTEINVSQVFSTRKEAETTHRRDPLLHFNVYNFMCSLSEDERCG